MNYFKHLNHKKLLIWDEGSISALNKNTVSSGKVTLGLNSKTQRTSS